MPDHYIIILFRFQIELRPSLGLDISLTELKETDHSSVGGLAGGSVNGSLVASNGTFYSNSSDEEAFNEFGMTCKIE